MIVEERRYTLRTGQAPEYLRLYEQYGLPVQKRHLPPSLGCYVTEVGRLNTVMHLWAYESFEERKQRRSAMRADPEWPLYLARIQPLIVRQQTQLLLPASFFDVAGLRRCLAAHAEAPT